MVASYLQYSLIFLSITILFSYPTTPVKAFITSRKSIQYQITNLSMVKIRNFRESLPQIYRCADTDPLADYLLLKNDDENSLTNTTNLNEELMLSSIGLVIDLRSASERNETKANYWTEAAHFHIIDDDLYSSLTQKGHTTAGSKMNNDKYVMRVDLLSPTKLYKYLSDNWLTPQQRALSMFYQAFDIQSYFTLQMDILNEKGLFGLYEAIVMTGRDDILKTLCAVTVYLENNNKNRGVCIHCVQGKDRTGLILMLIQSIMNVSETEIIDDYHLSHGVVFGSKPSSSSSLSAAAKKMTDTNNNNGRRLDRQKFSGAPREVMMATLDFIKMNFGSVEQYLDSLGFDKSWRRRLRQVIQTSKEDDVAYSRL